LTSEVTTLRRHMDSMHRDAYEQWAQANNFTSMLPRDSKRRKQDAQSLKESQQRLDAHLRERDTTIPYSDSRFCKVAIEWLVATDQPIQALEHPKYKEMIDVAASATKGVKIPNQKQSRAAVIDHFKENLRKLRRHLLVWYSTHSYVKLVI
ncbi:hypothetical protein F5887DRAFT_891284, partial [Amanita rubescens]